MNKLNTTNKSTKPTFFGVEDVYQGHDLSADQILDMLIEMKKNLDNLAASCVGFKPYKPKDVCAPMVSLGCCINCGIHEESHK